MERSSTDPWDARTFRELDSYAVYLSEAPPKPTPKPAPKLITIGTTIDVRQKVQMRGIKKMLTEK